MKPEHDHHATFRKLASLWPAMTDESSKMCLNAEQRRQWIAAIEPLNQCWMREAASRAYRAAPSRFLPTIETLMTHFRAVAQDHAVQPEAAQPPPSIETAGYVGGTYDSDRDAVLADLERWDQADVLAARERFRASKWAGVLEGAEPIPGNESDEPRDWSEGRRGFVHARYILDHPVAP